MKLADTEFLLRTSLQAGVPLLIAELKACTAAERDARIRGWAKDGAEAVAHRGDTLMFRGKPGATAPVWTALARGVAAGAFMPGGITVFGDHWCVDHDQCRGATTNE